MGSCKSAVDRFAQVFPEWGKQIVKWTPNKDGCVRIELEDKRFFIFTYMDERTWKLETVRMHSKEVDK